MENTPTFRTRLGPKFRPWPTQNPKLLLQTNHIVTMETQDALEQLDTDVAAQSLILAAATHEIEAVRNFLRTVPATVQDPETGFTPLHAAIAAFDDEEEDEVANGDMNGVPTADQEEIRKREIEAAAEIVRLLLQNGAIWNDVDSENETPGDIAYRLDLKELYDLIVDAGVRAELLLMRLSEYQPLASDENEAQNQDEAAPLDPATSNQVYLASNLTQSDTAILDSASNGVMMTWEKPIMERHAALLLPRDGLRVLNIGHGMGIIDNLFQDKRPTVHHIIEAHPDVLARMKRDSWYDKPGIVVHEGRWQDVLPKLSESQEEIVFDAIFFDTFAEDYSALRTFFSEWVVQFLDAEGKVSFFNGLGADRQVCYDVYQKVVEMDLFEAGFDVEWEEIDVPDLEERGEWTGIRRPYWTLDTYKLPTCTFVG